MGPRVWMRYAGLKRRAFLYNGAYLALFMCGGVNKESKGFSYLLTIITTPGKPAIKERHDRIKAQKIDTWESRGGS